MRIGNIGQRRRPQLLPPVPGTPRGRGSRSHPVISAATRVPPTQWSTVPITRLPQRRPRAAAAAGSPAPGILPTQSNNAAGQSGTTSPTQHDSDRSRIQMVANRQAGREVPTFRGRKTWKNGSRNRASVDRNTKVKIYLSIFFRSKQSQNAKIDLHQIG